MSAPRPAGPQPRAGRGAHRRGRGGRRMLAYAMKVW